jgi:hypothetical protein
MKGSRASASELEILLNSHTGIESVVANPTTGTVLVHYDPTRIDPVAILQGMGLGERAARNAVGRCRDVNASQGIRSRLAETLMAEFLEVAVVGLVGALA